MDITNIPQTLIKALEQKNTEQLVALSRVLNLVLGKTVIAEITSTAPVTEAESAELLKQTAAALAQINKQNINQSNLTPAVKAEISRLLQQQHLIQSPELKWVNLVVNNRPLLTYSDRPLTAGQSIPVQLQNPQKLVLLDLPALDPAKLMAAKAQAVSTIALTELLKTTITELTSKSPAVAVTDLNANKAILEKIIAASVNAPVSATNNKAIVYRASDLSLKFSTHTETKNISPENTAAKNIVSDNLRNLLPHRDTPALLLSAITQLQQLPTASRLQLISPNVEQALKSLAEKIRSPEQLSQPKILAQTLKNSGVFFEHKLNQFAQQHATASTENKNSDSHTTNNALSRTYMQDTKGALLTLLSRVTQEVNGDNKPLSSEQTVKLLQHISSGALFNPAPGFALALNSKSDFAQVLVIFIQQLMHKPVKELSDKELRTQLLVLLQQHSVHSLAKIQLQQLHSLNHELETKDGAAPSASWQLEIPVKHQNDLQHLHLRIDREWVDEKNESESNKSSSKIKQWSVTLRFDLPTLGEFCAQLAIINTQVSATLWAAQEKTFSEVRDHIEGLRKQLESEGIQVKYLQCMRGMPPEKPMALSYSLIDIST